MGMAEVLLSIKVVPGASRDQVSGMLGDRLKVRISAPAEGGKANKAVCRLIAGLLGIKAGAVEVVNGKTSPEKVVRVRVSGIESEQGVIDRLLGS